MQGTVSESARRIVACDIGGTHARFALATIDAGVVLALDDVVTLEAAEFPSFEVALEAYALSLGRPLPSSIAMAFAGPVDGDVLRMTNNPWTIEPQQTRNTRGLSRFLAVNDFAAVGHAVLASGQDAFERFAGPDRDLPQDGVVSIVGAGTGLGVSLVLRGKGTVIATEGGHVDLAPLDELEDEVLRRLRIDFGRVSVERVLSGPGLLNLYRVLAAIWNEPAAIVDQRQLWTAAIAGSDPLARRALERFCLMLGSVCGDFVLAHGAEALVFAGGIVPRLGTFITTSGFEDRFTAKGRFTERMRGIPVFRILHPEPGLLGAAVAFAAAEPGAQPAASEAQAF